LKRRGRSLQSKKILVVDDNPDDVVLTTRAFRKFNLVDELIIAGDGVEALKYLFGDRHGGGRKMEELPSLVLLDIKMPRINGLEVLREIRAAEKTKAVPVVIFTSSGEESDIIASRKLGANNYIQKPVNFSDFIEVIRQLVFSMNLHRPPAIE
jgi:two-component system, response regulator